MLSPTMRRRRFPHFVLISTQLKHGRAIFATSKQLELQVTTRQSKKSKLILAHFNSSQPNLALGY